MVDKDTVIQEMLKNIPDPKLRENYGRLLSGQIVKQVMCMSKVCKGRVIATLDAAGAVTETKPVIDPKGKYGLYTSGLEGSRQRFDGALGFRCYCGNNSILCEEEKGVLNPLMPVPPSEDDLLTIATRLSKRTQKLPLVGPVVNIDGFKIEEVRI